jgi:peptidoglycan/LPS O-acetylase OafA/YrhL
VAIFASVPGTSERKAVSIVYSRQRMPQLDGLRAVAFFSVFLWHAVKVPPKLVLWAGVDLFFVLSGYLITGILLAAKGQSLSLYFGQFYERRTRRILPPYAIAAIFAAALFPVGLKAAWPWYTFFVSNVGQAVGANIPAPMTTFWSLAVEEQFYLLWPLVVIACSPRALRKIACAALVLVPIARVVFSSRLSVSSGIYLLTPFRLDLLLAGALVWRESRQVPKSWQGPAFRSRSRRSRSMDSCASCRILSGIARHYCSMGSDIA